MNNARDNLRKLQAGDPQLAFLDELVNAAEASIAPRRIILFGSRARGDASRRSDVDLAFDIDAQAPWGTFSATASEELQTLLELDLVRLDQADEHLRRSIDKEGVVIYDRQG